MAGQRSLAVFDLDGTLSDTRHRLRFVASSPKKWDAFFAASADDPPLTTGIALALQWAERCDLLYLTGRPERCREDTAHWLAEQGLPDGELWMRDAGDRRPARVTKPELLRRVAARRTVEVVVDDDQLVCDAYRRAGFRVIHANWMPPSDTLDQAQEETGRT